MAPLATSRVCGAALLTVCALTGSALSVPPGSIPNLPQGQRLSPAEQRRIREIWELRALQQRGRHGAPAQGVMPPIIDAGPPTLNPPSLGSSAGGHSKKRKSASEKRAEAKLQAAEKKRQKKESRETSEKLQKRADDDKAKPAKAKPAPSKLPAADADAAGM